MEQRDKPGLLVLTTTFPRWAGDHEPPFVYELSRRLGDDFDITGLAPHAPGAQKDEIMDGIRVRRFRYAPDRLEKLAYDGGIPTRLRLYPWLALLLPSFLLAQIGAALQLVRERNPAVIHAHWLLPGGLIGAGPGCVPPAGAAEGGGAFSGNSKLRSIATFMFTVNFHTLRSNPG